MTVRCDTYPVDGDGVASTPIDNASSGVTPFGFAFTDVGNAIVSEAFAPMPNQSAASSYSVSDNGTLNVISGSVHNGQTASCWVVIPNNNRIAFVANTGSGTISSYRIGDDGSLTLLNAVAANTGANSAPRDMAVSVNGRLLFVQTGGGISVAVFSVRANGSLMPAGTTSGLPFGAQGIVAK